MTMPDLAVSKDRTVHLAGCPGLAGSPRCTCVQPEIKSKREDSMSPVNPPNCKCGSAAKSPAMKAQGRWVVACSREGCPALVQAATKQSAADLWDNLSTGLN